VIVPDTSPQLRDKWRLVDKCAWPQQIEFLHNVEPLPLNVVLRG